MYFDQIQNKILNVYFVSICLYIIYLLRSDINHNDVHCTAIRVKYNFAEDVKFENIATGNRYDMMIDVERHFFYLN